MRHNFKLSEWLVQPQLNTISSNGAITRLEPKAMEVLLYLAQNRGEVISKEQLIKDVWANRFVTEEVLTNAIFELRKALGDEAKNPRFIQTIPKKGYRLIAPVTSAQTPVAEAARPSRWGLATAAALILFAATLLAVKAGLWSKETTAGAERIEALAVLPLKDISNDEAQAYFADGMTEALITDLSRLLPLRVISRTSVMQYRDAEKPASEIGRELNVDALVEGSVLRSGDRLRVTIRLVRAADDQPLWGESYERELRDVIALQRELSRDISKEIKLNVRLQSEVREAGSRLIDSEAYETYLKGRQLAEAETEEAINRAREHFERAIRLDSSYAPAHTGLAGTYISLIERNYVRPDEAYLKAKSAIVEALRLDDHLAEAHALLAVVRIFFDRDWPGAESEFRRALQLNPNYAKAHLWYGEYLWAAGRKEEAIAEIKAAQSLDPMSLDSHMAAGNLLFNLRRYDEAMEGYRRALSIDPGHALAHKGLGHCYHQKAMNREAEAEYDRYKELTGTPRAINLPAGLEKWARDEDTKSVIHAFSKVLSHKYVRPTHLARIYLELGERDRAFYWLERAYEERDSRLLFLKSDDGWQPVKHDPRYAEMIRRIGLTP